MNRNGYSYLEVIICMTLVSIISLCLANSLKIAIKKDKYAYENHYLDITAENLLNMTHSALDNNNFPEQILEIKEQDNSYFYSDKFNFVVRIDEIYKISDDLYTARKSLCTLNPGSEDVLSIDTEIKLAGKKEKYVFEFDSNKDNFLITVDLFDRNHKLLKRVFKIC